MAVDDAGFTVEPDPEEPDGCIVRGARPERWVRQTDFDNDEAVGYLADRLARLGVEDALAKAGAQPGCPVTIGNMTFDWEPTTPAGIAVLHVGCAAPTSGSSRTTASVRPSARWRAAARRRHRSDADLAIEAAEKAAAEAAPEEFAE